MMSCELDVFAGDNNKGSNKEMAPKSNVARIRNWLGFFRNWLGRKKLLVASSQKLGKK